MSKTIKELADEFGVSKTAIRNKLTEEFRSKWVQTSTTNGVQTLVITEEGVNALKSMLQGGNQTANLGANQPQTGLQSIEFYEEEIRELRKLLDQSQQLLLNEQKKNQLLLETKAEPADWEKEKAQLENQVSIYRSSWSEVNARANNNYAYAENVERWLWIVGVAAGVLLVLVVILSWLYFKK
ncbi:hypothetical protein SAMN02910293_02414 [Streptococcus henryi]|uniref:Uncharacterized protein n=1 Tax=Streptococcus henryi TaxID=439219 RepID=A0A1G6DU33_9STRE|nr:hypothetical protein [Streptococcus henryi]SDB48628.1 hypothetical protein SAMN02910293_02414 [Streptococcus henryi]